MGWRSWNLYGANVNQGLMEGIMKGMLSRTRTVDGVPTSLLDLGYFNVGLDDNWQECGSYGPENYTYHDVNGSPVVNTARFPSLKNMTDYAHSLGLSAGFYSNNCICSDHCNTDACYEGDVNAIVGFGFDAVKLDGCGQELDLTKWANLINASGRSITIENCHWGDTIPNKTWCPFNFYRSSGDVRANYASIISNLQTVIPLAEQNLSTPGCYAYPDMLEVGCADGPGGHTDTGLTIQESRSHFGGWVIVSSPLTLSHDVNNDTITDFIWPIIANPEAIAINQAYFGFSGSTFAEGVKKIELTPRISPAPLGKYVVAVVCDSSDASQLGWGYNTVTRALMFQNQCVDSTDGSQLVLSKCTNSVAQQFVYSNTSQFNTITQGSNCVDVWEGNGAPGGPIVQMFGCHSSATNEVFQISDISSPGAARDKDNMCLASRATIPGSSPNYQHFYKPLSWDGSKTAVLLMNHLDTNQDLGFNFTDVPGLSGSTCLVRDIWLRQDVGSFTGGFTVSQVEGHDAAFYTLTCA